MLHNFNHIKYPLSVLVISRGSRVKFQSSEKNNIDKT